MQADALHNVSLDKKEGAIKTQTVSSPATELTEFKASFKHINEFNENNSEQAKAVIKDTLSAVP